SGPASTNATDAIIVFWGTPGRLSVVTDPFNPNIVYVANPNASGRRRVVRVASILEVQPIADNLPDSIKLDVGEVSGYGVPGVALAADPKLPGVLYLGSNNGLYEGRPQGDGYLWSLNQDVPETLISG